MGKRHGLCRLTQYDVFLRRLQYPQGDLMAAEMAGPAEWYTDISTRAESRQTGVWAT